MTTPGGDVTAVGRLIFDASAVRAGAAQATGSLTSLYEVVRNNWWGLRAIGEAAGAIGGAITGGLAASIKAAADFQTGMAQVARTTQLAGETADEAKVNVGGLGEELRRIAETRPIDIGTLSGIAAQAGQLGIARKDVGDFTKTIADLTTTTNLTADSATTLAKIGNLFQLSGKDYAALGSAIFDVGRKTAATETDIVNFTTRLAPFAAQAGLTASQTVGLAAATASLGPRAEAGSTALQRLFRQMADASIDKVGQDYQRLANTLGVTTTELTKQLRAVDGNRDALNALANRAGLTTSKMLSVANAALTGTGPLDAFAKITGVTNEEFKNLLVNNPAEALTSFIEGLAKQSTNSVTATAALQDLGITETREINTLEALARGVRNGDNSYVNLRQTLKLTNAAYNDGTLVQKAAQSQNETLNAKIKESQNTWHNLGISLGNNFVPSADLGVEALKGLAHALEALPSPVQGSIGAFVGIIGLTLQAASAFTLMAARSFLARMAYEQTRNAIIPLIGAQRLKIIGDTEETVSTNRVAFAAGRNRVELSAEIAEKARQAQLIRVVAALRTAELRIMQEQAEIERLLAASALAESKGLASKAALLRADVAARVANVEAIGVEVTALRGEQAALAATTGEVTAATTAMYSLGSATRVLTGPIGIAIGVLATVAAGTIAFGNAQQDEAQKAEIATSANYDYVEALVAVNKGQKDAVNIAIAKSIADEGLITQAKKFGLTLNDLIGYIHGNAEAQARFRAVLTDNSVSEASRDYGGLLGKLKEGLDFLKQGVGDDTAYATKHATKVATADFEAFLQRIIELQNQFKASQAVASDTAAAEDFLGVSFDKASKKAQNQADSIGKLDDGIHALNGTMAQNKVTTDEAAQAGQSLASDEVSVEQATLQLTQANRAYKDALEDSKHAAEEVAAAERAVEDAQLAHQKAAEDVKLKERALASARQDAQRQLKSDQLSAADAQSAYLDSLDKVKDAEKTLHDLQSGEGERLLTEAIHKLNDARATEANAVIGVHDAEANLAYLRGEGASTRDIADAERELTDARNKQKDASDGVGDAQKSVNDARAAISPAGIAKAERDVQDAVRASEEAEIRLHEANDKVKDDRYAVVHDLAYKDALRDLKEAQNQLADSGDRVRDAQQKLADTREAVAGQEALKEAEINLKNAAIQLASAQSQLKSDQLTANGVFVSAHDKMELFKNALSDAADKINSKVRPAVQNLAGDIHAVVVQSQNFGNTDITPTVSDKGLGATKHKLTQFSGWIDTYIRNIVGKTKGVSPIVPLLLPADTGTVINILPHSAHIDSGGKVYPTAKGGIFSSTTDFDYNGQHRTLGEAGSEAIIPLDALYQLLAPLRPMSDSIQELEEVLVRAMRQPTDTATTNSTTHHNNFDITAYTEADAALIGRDIVWEMRHSL